MTHSTLMKPRMMKTMTKLTVVIGVHNQFDISKRTIELLAQHADNPQDIQLVIVDNGSKTQFMPYPASESDIADTMAKFGFIVNIVKEKNEGNYPVIFSEGLKASTSDIIMFMHSDVFVVQQGWDSAVIAQFEANANLGLVGVIGSTQIDNFGGRGLGTSSNFQGGTYPKKFGYDVKRCRNCDKFEADHAVGQACDSMDAWGDEAWTGSRAEVHGRRDEGFIIDGAVIDGCVMIFRKGVLEQIGFKDNYPLHHFYDRAMSVQVREAGYKVAILGLRVDHISGQTANHEESYHNIARDWAFKKWGITEPQQWAELAENADWFKNPQNPSKGNVPGGWDHVVYLTAEKLFLEEYRDQKHIIPINC